ncbi:Acidic mammalian chitinase [Pseudolycoriella hygida]|uniref:Acidic mammalian chitinase n=1 Tax=Pseudolycoriella hygida TaxID=35572 RepID=A0A9Q0NBY6_9DIPT|nr:Acidic mammalian chitinase [Pseudolycoriella hygida]
MKLSIFLSAALLFLAASNVQAQTNRRLLCYWMPGIPASHINPWLCTHIAYSFLGLTAQGGLTFLWRSEAEVVSHLQSVVALKAQNPALQIIIAVGGYNVPLVPVWSAMAASAAARNSFANNLLAFVRQHNLNGVDIDWEFPNYDGTAPQDRDNFSILMETLRAVLPSEYSLSAAIGAGAWRTNLSYDIPRIFVPATWIGLMTYDLHGSWEPRTGLHTAMYRSSLDPTDQNVDASVQLVLSRGGTRDKLYMGLASYGIGFTLDNAALNGVGAPASGGPFMAYNQICQRLNANTLTRVWEPTQLCPYAFQGTLWVGYEDRESIIYKANYIVNQNLGGGLFWVLDDDDHSNVCGHGNFPIIWPASDIIVWGWRTRPSMQRNTTFV